MWKWIVLLIAGAVAALGGWLYFLSSRPAEVPFARPRVEPIEAIVTTNGKVELAAWISLRAETAALISSVSVSKGQRVGAGQTIAATDTREARAELVAAEARMAQVSAEIATLERGGRPSEIALIEGDIARAEVERKHATRDLAVIERLITKRAATQSEADAARDRIDRANAQLAAAEARRKALVNAADLESARARLADATAAAKLARERIALGTFTAPMSGTIFELAVRPGAYVQPGELIASVGGVEGVRAVLYVDEPDLGRVRSGLPVTITWDALPGREWVGTVDRVPTQVAPLGTRQVGEVICRLDNPGGLLLPGTNINAAIRTGRVESALTIPKETIRRQDGVAGVYVLQTAQVRWRPLKLGLASITRVEVIEGLAKDEVVALPAGHALSDGLAVTPIFP